MNDHEPGVATVTDVGEASVTTGRSPAPEQVSDLVTVIIPAKDESGFIGDCLAAVQAQTHERLQVVVVVDGATRDDTAGIVAARSAADPRIEQVTNHRGGIPESLNLALAAARGRWLVRVDSHSTIPADYVATVVALLADGGWGGVGGRKDGRGVTPAGRAIAAALGSPFGVGGSVYHHGEEAQEVDHIPFGAYPTALVRELGGWDEDLVANEDFEFDHRLRLAGHRLLFDPSVTISWHSRQTVGDLYRQYRRYGRGKVAVAVKHPRSMRPRHVLVPAFVGYLGLAAAVATLGRRPRVAAAMVAPYAAAVAVASARTGAGLDTAQERVHVAPAFLAMHVGWGIGFWTGVGSALADRMRSATRKQR